MLKSFYFTLAFLFISTLSAQGLAGAKNLDRAVLINLGYGPFTSAGDLSNRFGSGWSIDGGATWIPPHSTLDFRLRGQDGFGTALRDDVLAGLRTR